MVVAGCNDGNGIVVVVGVVMVLVVSLFYNCEQIIESGLVISVACCLSTG